MAQSEKMLKTACVVQGKRVVLNYYSGLMKKTKKTASENRKTSQGGSPA
jgi:ribosomal protein S17